MLGLGIPEFLILVVLALIFFGAGKLGFLAKLLGRSVGHFREGARDADSIDITPLKKEDSD